MNEVKQYIPYDSGTAELEQQYLNDLKYSRIAKNLEFASNELDRLIGELKSKSEQCELVKLSFGDPGDIFERHTDEN